MKLRKRNFTSIGDAEKAFADIGCDSAGIKIMCEKGLFLTQKVTDISLRAAIILKQEMMALGGEVVLDRDVMTLKLEKTDALILGTQKQYRKLCQKLYQQPFGCKEIAALLKEYLDHNINAVHASLWKWKDKELCFSKPLIMGIVNITPDSFSDAGKYLDPRTAVLHAKKLAEEGADILDLGAESSRPGSDPVSEQEELRRLLPVLDALLSDPSIKVPLSIDTYKPAVAAACLERGAHIINDITCAQNPEMRSIAAHYDVPLILMHMQGTPKTMQENPHYHDVVDEIIDFFEQQIHLCRQEKVTKIICDPGIGFGKTVDHNLEILKRLQEFSILSVPLLIGTSRKSFIQKTIGGTPDDRLEGTLASNVIAALHGAQIFRVHDVKACKRALDITDFVLHGAEKC